MVPTAGIKFSGGGGDSPYGLEIDSQDNVYVAGITGCNNTNYIYYAPAKIGNQDGVDYTFTNNSSSCQNIYLTKFSSAGVFQWIHFLHPPQQSTNNQNFNDDVYGFLNSFTVQNDVLYWALLLPAGTYENGALVTTAQPNGAQKLYVLSYSIATGTFLSAMPLDIQFTTYQYFISSKLYRNPHNGMFYWLYRKTAGFIAATDTLAVNGGTVPVLHRKDYIISFNAQGNYLWHTTTTAAGTGTDFNFQFGSIDFDPQNNIYLTGKAFHSNPATTFLNWICPNDFEEHPFYMKLNPTATAYEWVKEYVGTTGDQTIKYTPTQLYSVGSIATSFTFGSFSVTGPGSNNGSDPLLTRLNPATGDCMGLHRIIGPNGHRDVLTSLAIDANNDVILGGFMSNSLTDVNNTTNFSYGGNTDFFIAKFANQACASLSTSDFETATIEVFPNPAKDKIQINITEEVTYTLYNIMGVVVQKGKLSASDNILNSNNLSSGCYILQLTNAAGVVKSVKVIKE